MSKATTKKAISYAVKELLLEKPLNKITVNDITSKCEINRQTFYYHFLDIQDLIEWICFEDADKAIKDKINEAIPLELIRTRKGGGNKELSYISGITVIDKLNTIFGIGSWSWTIKQYWIEKGDEGRRMGVYKESELMMKGIKNGK